MSFRISKSPFFFHFLILYLRCCSPIWRNFFFVTSLMKLILVLNLFYCSINDSSMQFARSVTDLFLTILWKADSKLLKQQLLDDSGWYFSTNDFGWNPMFSVIFSLPIGTTYNWYVFISWPLIFLIKKIIEIWLTCTKLFF